MKRESSERTGNNAGGTAVARLALVALFAGVVGIALSPIFVKVSEVGPIATALYRVLLALPFLWLWAGLADRDADAPTRSIARGDLLALALSGFFFAGDLAFWHLSLGLTSVASSTLLVNLASIFVALAAWLFFGERLGPRFVVGLLAALTGVALLVGGGGGLGSGHLAGDGLAVIAAISYAGYILSVSRLRSQFSTVSIMAVGGVATCASLLPVALLSGEELLPTTVQGVGCAPRAGPHLTPARGCPYRRVLCVGVRGHNKPHRQSGWERA